MTVSVAQDSKKGKRSHAIIPLRPLEIISVIFEEKVKEIRNSNEGVFLTQPAPVGVRQRVLGGVEAYNVRSLCAQHCNQGVPFYESTPSTRDPMGNKISPEA